MSNLIIKFRWPIIIFFLAVTGFFASQLPKMEIDPEVKNMLPKTFGSRVANDRIEDIFGGSELLMVLLETDDVLNPETLKRVRKLSKKINRIKGVDKVMSLFDLKNIKSEQGAMIVDPAVKRIPKTDEQREVLRQELKDNDMVYGMVVSENFRLTSIIAVLEFNVPSDSIVNAVVALSKEITGPEKTVVGGFPLTRMFIAKDIQGDMRKLLPYGIGIMLVFLFICFRQLRGVFLPFIVVVMSAIFTMGLMPLLGWKLVMISILVPVILLAVANDYGIHIIARFQEDNFKGNTYTKQELAKRTFVHLGAPILLAGLTTFAGMMCLTTHVLIPAKRMGILAGAGIIFALFASLFFIPAVLSIIPKPKPVVLGAKKGEKAHFLERILEYFGHKVSKKPKAIIWGALIFSLAASSGIFFVIIDADPNNYFPDDHQVIQASKLINKHFGGMQNINILFKGDIKDPRLMARIDSVERALKSQPVVGITSSIARMVRMMSRALNDKGEPGYDVVPVTRQAVAQYFELYSMSGDPDDFEKMVDFPYEHAIINARINTESTPVIKKLMNTTLEMVKNDKEFQLLGGFSLILVELADIIIYGQLVSLFMAIGIVMVLIMIMFRSVAAGLISAVPLFLSMGILFGLMGFFGIHLNIATAMLSSIMIGVGIDYTLHFLWRYRDEMRAGLNPADAAHKALTTTGRGIVFNALSVIIGFVVLMLSAFMPVKFFGILVVLSIFACLVGAMLLIPALCIVIRPKFLEGE